MKKLNLLLVILIGLTILSCSSDDNNDGDNNNPIETETFFKKSITYVNGIVEFTREIFYDSNNKVQSIISEEISFNRRTLQIEYSNEAISAINEDVEYDNLPNFSQTYNVIIELNKIILTGSVDDRTIEIYHTDNYVDLTKVIQTSTSTIVFENIFLRNQNQNIISITDGNIIFTYSNFDSNKKNDPSGASMTYEFDNFFKIFNIKVSKDNPLNSEYNQQGNTGTENIYLEYDNLDNVIRKSYEPNSTDNYTEHLYIELE